MKPKSCKAENNEATRYFMSPQGLTQVNSASREISIGPCRAGIGLPSDCCLPTALVPNRGSNDRKFNPYKTVLRTH
jgi:hypothetical protein